MPWIALHRSTGVTQCPAAHWSRNCHDSYITVMYLLPLRWSSMPYYRCEAKNSSQTTGLAVDHESGLAEGPGVVMRGVQTSANVRYRGGTYYLLNTTHYPSTTHYSLTTTHYPLPTTHYPLPTTHYTLTTTYYPLPITYCPLSTTRYVLPNTYYSLPTSYCLLVTAPFLFGRGPHARDDRPAAEPHPQLWLLCELHARPVFAAPCLLLLQRD